MSADRRLDLSLSPPAHPVPASSPGRMPGSEMISIEDLYAQ